jgi:HEAT repeat protein
MKSNELNPLTAVAPVLATSALSAGGAVPAPVAELVRQIKSTEDPVRGKAWQNAGSFGVEAVQPLAEVTSDANFEVARSAVRALWKIVRDAGRPGNAAKQRAIGTALIALLGDGQPDALRREVMWMLSEIGGDDSIEPIARILAQATLREDARMVLERIPGERSLAALKSALETVPVEFRYHLAVSLRKRGVPVQEYPSQKLVPQKKTSIQAL